MAKKTRIVYKSLRKYWGWADEVNTDIPVGTISLSKKMKGKKHLEILCHEKLHIMLPHHDEKSIRKMGIAISEVLWSDGYRKVK